MKDMKELEGVLLIDKPIGLTSHDVVDRVRRKLKMKRIRTCGYAGSNGDWTLDNIGRQGD